MFIEEGSICFGCAKKLMFEPLPYDVGVWMDDCVVCGEHKSCTDARHDWKQRLTFSYCWSEELGEAIKARAYKDFTITFGAGSNPSGFNEIRDAVNQGIDSHLEAVRFDQNGNRFNFHGDTLHVLVRRLLETEDYSEEGACSMASGICECLGIELI